MNRNPPFDKYAIEREGDEHDGEAGESGPAEKLVEESDGDGELEGGGDERSDVLDLVCDSLGEGEEKRRKFSETGRPIGRRKSGSLVAVGAHQSHNLARRVLT